MTHSSPSDAPAPGSGTVPRVTSARTSTTSRAATPTRKKVPVGAIAFVAAGPGDPDLVTVRAAALLHNADVVLADADAVPTAQRHAGPGTTVEAATDADGLPLERPARAKRVVELAREGRSVVRLLAGDPVLDGALAAEAAVVHRSRLTFEVAPGVSTVSGVAAYAGVPLTERAVPRGQGHRRRHDADVDWALHADPRVTLVVVDGADRAVEIASALVLAGRRARDPGRASPAAGPRSTSAPSPRRSPTCPPRSRPRGSPAPAR